MRVVLQRVNSSSVVVDGQTIGLIERGLMLLVGFGKGDNESKLHPMAEKISHLRVFPDDRGRFHFSIRDIQGGVLLVPQFTLFGDARKGRRPDFNQALDPEQASELFNQFVELFRSFPELTQVETGQFGAHMLVGLENDGPVTLWLDSDEL